MLSLTSVPTDMSTKEIERKWGDIPPYLKEVNMVFDPDGQFIACVACKKYDDRAQSKNGKVTCTRGRIHKHDYMKNHIETHHHKACILKVLKENDAKVLTKEEFKEKYGLILIPRRATVLTAFFRPTKKPKHSGPAAEEAPIPTAPQGSNVIVIDESESEGNASNSMAIQSETSVPLRHATLACAKKTWCPF